MEVINFNVTVNQNKPIWSIAIQRKFHLPVRFDELDGFFTCRRRWNYGLMRLGLKKAQS